MTTAPLRAPVFVYDGDCAFCSACARFITRHVVKGRNSTVVTAWQFADLRALGLTEAECDSAVQWVGVDRVGKRIKAAGPVAIARLLRGSGWLWRGVGGLLGTRAVLAVAWPVYNWIARHRDRMPGGTAACALPQAERDRLGTGRYARTGPVQHEPAGAPAADARKVSGISVEG